MTEARLGKDGEEEQEEDGRKVNFKVGQAWRGTQDNLEVDQTPFGLLDNCAAIRLEESSSKIGAEEWNAGEGRTAHPRPATTRVHSLFTNTVKCFPDRGRPCKRLCHSFLVAYSPPPPSPPSIHKWLSDTRELEEDKRDRFPRLRATLRW